MNSNPLRSNSSRFEGCTVTGALAVTAFVNDAVSIVHGPDGCSHINASLFHTTLLQHGICRMPDIFSSSLGDNEVIFGGEEALADTIDRALSKNPAAVFVIGTCIAETIGDDINAVCSEYRGVPVIPIPGSGFLGGSFHDGYRNALISLSSLIDTSASHDGGVNLIGEKNLEFEVEENYREVSRLLTALGLDVQTRFVRNADLADLRNAGSARLNVFREDPDGLLRRHFDELTGIPSIGSFPVGLGGTIEFLEEAGRICGIDAREAVAAERALQKELADEFSDLRGVLIAFDSFGFQCTESVVFNELAEAVGLSVDVEGIEIPIPMCMPVGTSGLKRMLHQWRRFIHA